jgi:hypothetical protein
MKFLCIVVPARVSAGNAVARADHPHRRTKVMAYLKDLIERLGKAIGIGSKSPASPKAASPSKLVPAKVPAQDPPPGS